MRKHKLTVFLLLVIYFFTPHLGTAQDQCPNIIFNYLVSFAERPYGELSEGRILNTSGEILNNLQAGIIFPNPSPGKFDIILPEYWDLVPYRLDSHSDSLIKTGTLTNTCATLDLYDVDKGVYLLKIIGDKTELIKKIIII